MDDAQREAIISFMNACESGDIAAARQSLPLARTNLKLAEAFSVVAKRKDHKFFCAMVDEFGLDKNEALRQAVVRDDMAMVEYLLQKGVDPLFDNGRDIKIAVFNGYVDLFRKLLDNVQASDEMLFSLALRAAENFQKDILDELLDNRIDLHWQDEKLLREVASKNRPQTDSLEYLIARGADVHVLNEAPLARAIQNSRFINIPVLLEAGADPMLLTDDAREDMDDMPISVLVDLKRAEKDRAEEAQKIVAGFEMPHDLMHEHGDQKMTGMMFLLRSEGLKLMVMKITNEKPDWASVFNAEILTRKHGLVSPLDIAIRTEQHRALFAASLWINREDEMKKLWDELPVNIRVSMPWEETVRDLRACHEVQSKQNKLLNRVSGLSRLRR